MTVARYVVKHIAVKEGQGFDVLASPMERVLSVEHDTPWFHVYILAMDDGGDPLENDGNGEA